ncbi:putative membrane protein [Tistlia consotensis]|uniref:Putative membrane protein n=1 Tax=Tistlia consotensis USBA 355 TaxID=560819 RepID=A0A1Y6BYH3_9PROT|nr:SHOCT domain-containing protein [Tistlia consotensis]SMF27393.1 putative membrane protein [Tistlia consotensis USBA 355]SNR66109.1 putative membrane protein [Tistlia consotensis]
MMFGGLAMILFWGALIVLVVLLVRRFGARTTRGDAASPPSASTPLDILNERFARGEIDKEEFEERKKLLSK